MRSNLRFLDRVNGPVLDDEEDDMIGPLGDDDADDDEDEEEDKEEDEGGA